MAGGAHSTTGCGTVAEEDSAPAQLTAAVGELERLSRFDSDLAAERAEHASTTARQLGLTELELRARLVQADMVRRRGDVATAGRTAQDVRRWATDNASRHLLSRAHFLLAAVCQELGDLSLALEHAVQAVDLLDEGAHPALRIDHLARLADCLGLQGDRGASERYTEVLQLAEEVGDVDRQLLVLNNRAYVETLAGEFGTALALATRMQGLAAEHGIALSIGRLDTVARALIGLGRLAEAEEVLLPGRSPDLLDASPDGDAGADFLLTLAEIQRRRGRVPEAQQTLDECTRRCDQYGLTSIRVRARREQAELHAAGADYRAAFEEHRLYCQEALDLQSAQRDARARALQAMYETTEARRQTRRYRELSLRDPLTGLYNRRYVDEQLPRLLGALGGDDPAGGGAAAVSVALLDLDHFKQVNDSFSHDVGDRVLSIVGELLQRAGSRQPGAVPDAGSFAARMGGEEFLLVLVGADRAQAVCALEEVRREVSAHPWGEVAPGLSVTISIGVASAVGVPDPAPSELLGRADAHLYRAKRQGRDRVVTDLD